jgi:hypothetical protein
MSKGTVSTWLSGLFLVVATFLLFGHVLVQGDIQSLVAQHEAAQSGTSTALADLRTRMEAIAQHINTPPTILAAESVAPHTKTTPSVDALAALEALEARVNDKAGWPTDIASADAMLAEAKKLAGAAPTLEPALLPRVDAMGWSAYVLRNLLDEADSEGSIEQWLDTIDTAMAVEPPGVSAAVVEAVEQKRNEMSERLDELKRVRVVAEAERLIKEGGTDEAYADADAALVAIQTVPDWQKKASRLLLQIRARALVDHTKTLLASIPDRVSRAQTERSAVTRQLALADLLGIVVSQRQHVLSRMSELKAANDPELPTLPSKLADQSKLIEDKMSHEAKNAEKARVDQDAKALREYQAWALKNIDACDNVIAANTGMRVPGGTIDQNNYKAIARAMRKHLLPISVGHLEPAVGRLYGSVFETGWSVLENSKTWQTWLAQSEALDAKRPPK